MRSKSFTIGFLFLLASLPVFAQDPEPETDSLKLYKSIETYSHRSKFNKFIYRHIFKSTAPAPKKAIRKRVKKKDIPKPYAAFEDKIIRSIQIVSLDPFAFSIADTAARPHTFLPKAGNRLHIKSHSITLRNLLLIRENKAFDSLLVKESERLIRSQNFVRDVSFTVVFTSKKKDSVDILIRELDKWSIGLKASASTSRAAFQLTEQNFIGLGHEFKNSLNWYHTRGENATKSQYFIPNIRNTYINSNLLYSRDELGNYIRSAAVERPFFSSFARWAAGINLTQQLTQSPYKTEVGLIPNQRFKLNTRDFWAGHSMKLYKGRTEYSRTTNLITALRFIHTSFAESPPPEYDTLGLYSKSTYYLVSFGLSTRKYIQDKYIFKYGVKEDIPIGQVYNLTLGLKDKNGVTNMYLGTRASYGVARPWGYFYSEIDFGTYFKAKRMQESVVSLNVNYFTNLFEVGKWKFRQFFKNQVTIGFNRLPGDSITINDGYGLDGFSSPSLSGTSRILFSLQTQAYTPWDVIGFRFGPYLVYSIGMLGTESRGFGGSRVFSQIGLGLLIKNDQLVFNTFQISVGFYPSIPGKGSDIFLYNAVKTTDFGFRDFEIRKPSPKAFQ